MQSEWREHPVRERRRELNRQAPAWRLYYLEQHAERARLQEL